MTQNQIAYWGLQETVRHNKASEAIGAASNAVAGYRAVNDFALGLMSNKIQAKRVRNDFKIGMLNANTNRQGMQNQFTLGLLNNQVANRRINADLIINARTLQNQRLIAGNQNLTNIMIQSSKNENALKVQDRLLMNNMRVAQLKADTDVTTTGMVTGSQKSIADMNNVRMYILGFGDMAVKFLGSAAGAQTVGMLLK